MEWERPSHPLLFQRDDPDDLVAAHRYLESNVQFGKIVVNV